MVVGVSMKVFDSCDNPMIPTRMSGCSGGSERRDAETRRSEGRGRIDNALYAILQNRNVEVDEQSELQACDFEVSANLCTVDRRQAFDRFQFYQQLAADDQIDPPRTDLFTTVCH